MAAGLVWSQCLNQLEVFSSVFILTQSAKKPILSDLECPCVVVCSEDTDQLPSEASVYSVINYSSAHHRQITVQ